MGVRVCAFACAQVHTRFYSKRTHSIVREHTLSFSCAREHTRFYCKRKHSIGSESLLLFVWAQMHDTERVRSAYIVIVREHIL